MPKVSFIKKDKLFSSGWWLNYARLLAGALIMSLGYVLFIVPYKIVPGGVYGIAIVLNYYFGLPIGTMGLIMNIPLLVWGIRVLGPRFGAKTLVGLVLTSALIDLNTLWYGVKPLTEDPLASSIFGGVFIGVGLGLIFRSKATTGGSDIIAQIMRKKTNVPVGQGLILIDFLVVSLGVLAFKDFTLALYALITIFVTGKVVDTVVSGMNWYKSALIITSRPEELRRRILYQMGRGGTFLLGQGMFSGSDWKIVFCTVNRRELAILEEHVRETDPDAFMTVFDSSEVLGEGFQALVETDSLINQHNPQNGASVPQQV